VIGNGAQVAQAQDALRPERSAAGGCACAASAAGFGRTPETRFKARWVPHGRNRGDPANHLSFVCNASAAVPHLRKMFVLEFSE